MSLRLALLKIHRWIGLALCLWLAAVALTGSLLAFRAPIECLLGPHSYLIGRAAGPARFDSIMAAVAARYPDRQIIMLQRDGLRPDEALKVELTRTGNGMPVDMQATSFNPVRDADLEVFADPETGRILGERPYWNWMRIVYSLHTELLNPGDGKPYLGILGFCLLFIAVTGLVIWWPRPGRFWKSFRVATGNGKRRLLRDLHTTGGAIIALLLTVSALTGIFMCYEGPIVKTFRAWGIARATTMTSVAPAELDGQTISVQQAVNAATARYPDFDPVVVNLPSRGRGVFQVQLFPRHDSRVFWTVEASVGARDGRLISTFDPRNQPAANSSVLWVIFLHNGQMFGIVGRVAVLTIGLALGMLVLSGPWLWLLRKRYLR